MSTQAVPTPGTTSAANAYQTEFNSAYYLSKDPAFDPLFAGRPGSGNPSGTPLTVMYIIPKVGIHDRHFYG
jgi:hypothetical protein